MKVFAVAYDLLLEARYRRWFLALGGAVTLGLLLLLTSLRLDVVDGALAGSRLFGHLLSQDVQAVDVALRPVYQAASLAIFYCGMLFGIFACADFGPSLLSPGRIEHLLALPVRRWELLVGTFLGVLTLAVGAALYGAGGLTLIFGLKTGYWTLRPLISAALAGVGFASLYAGMLTTALFVRSAALSATVGMALFVSGLVASYRPSISKMLTAGVGRALFEAYTLFMPRVASLARAAAELTGSSAPPQWGRLFQLLAGFAAFALGALALGVWRFEQKDF